MELPHVGDHCTQADCKQLDYLPVKCNLCEKIFCHVHHRYIDHSCPESYKIDVRIPVCPLCDQPVPSKSGVAPDLAVSQHIENNCQSKSKKVYKNKCSATGCKIKELISVKCDSCQQNFCLRHRHSLDHDCQGKRATKSKLSNGGKERTNGSFNFSSIFGSSNSSRGSQGNSQPKRRPDLSSYQQNISEEEALRRAYLASQGELPSNSVPSNSVPSNGVSTSEDEDLARAIALSLQTDSSETARRRKTSDCSIS